MHLNSINNSVSPGGWANAGVMIGCVRDNDPQTFKAAVSMPTRWEHEALSSLAAAAIGELAGCTQETPEAILTRLVASFSSSRG